MLACGALFLISAWDEVNCVAGEFTSTGPCGIAIVAGGSLVTVAIFLLIIGAIVLFRGLRRPVEESGGDGWRVAQAVVVMMCGTLLALMIPRLKCPPGTTLSPVFRFCVSPEVTYPAPSPGLPWKYAAFGAGIVLGVRDAAVAVDAVVARLGARRRGMYRHRAVHGVALDRHPRVPPLHAPAGGRRGRDRRAGPGSGPAQAGRQTGSPSASSIVTNGSAKWVGATIVPG